MLNRNMRLFVLFDLPVVSKADRKCYSKFHKFLIHSGFFMLQYSVYCRVTQNHDDAKKHILLVDKNKPPKGSVRVLQITEKQFSSMQILVGERTKEEDFLGPKDVLEI